MGDNHVDRLLSLHPWTHQPIIALAPMRYIAGPEAALAVSAAGGIGFMNPQITREALFADFETARNLLGTRYSSLAKSSLTHMPLGVGFLLWGCKLENAVAAVQQYRPAIVWLYAGHGGQREIDDWSARLRRASQGTQVWLMVGTLQEVREAIASPDAPDVLVLQGSEAGGHTRIEDGSSWTTLLPETADLTTSIPLIAAGGIVNGRGVAASLAMGAAGAAMGTRFLASREARLSKGYQEEVLRTTDGAMSTTQSLLWNHLMGNYEWPRHLAPRGIINKSFTEYQAGVPFDELRRLHDAIKEKGDAAWGPEGRAATYAGKGVGLVRQVASAERIVKDTKDEALAIVRRLAKMNEGYTALL